tara:strand:- start:376 stop:624 length:249 start_codon:yes stop_codon:yes gene_type:complete
MTHYSVSSYCGDRENHRNREAESFLDCKELLGDGGNNESGVLQAVVWSQSKHHENRLGLSNFGELVAGCDKSHDEHQWKDSF